ncbi:MAG: methionyl-tRNA formyltransferase [Actinobacteria bacterium]|nr:methionyl-tRNA formyltransferase [Actinomycetota bacterium]
MRICFFGTPRPAVPSLEAFLAADDIDVVAVVTNPDRPAGRGYQLTPPPVKEVAVATGVQVWQPAKAREIVDDLRALDVDACAVVAYGALLPADVLAAGGKGFVNLHFSLLPAWRGAAPVPWAIRHGDEVLGVTCFVLDEGMDTGPILSEWSTRLRDGETAGEATERLAAAGANELVEALRGLVHGTIEPRAQDHAAATYAPKITPEDARVDWGASAAEVDRVVRAFNPMPGAFTEARDHRLKLHRVTVARDAAAGEPGRVVDHDEGAPVVACGQGAVRLDEVQPAGKARMDGRSYANGYRPQQLG